MKSLLWDKGGASVDDRIMAFTAGDDVVWDREIFAFDIEASIAHVKGLHHIDVLKSHESDALVAGLKDLGERFADGAFVLDARFEDGHSAIEAFLTEELGEVGKKVHTGRSRNDQVLVATRLYLKSALDEVAARCIEIAEIALERARETMFTPMPGYTHLQRAVPSSVGMWFAAFAEAFIDNAVLARSTHDWLDCNPLGTAAGYGVNLPLDREIATELMDFGRVQLSPIYAQNSRGKFELGAIGAYAAALLDVRRLAWDLSLFTTAEFAFVRLSDPFTTGSSIMPNKRNPDVVELLRAAYSTIAGARAELESVLSLPSGYHRDLQNTKPPICRATRRTLAALGLVPMLLRDLTFDEAALSAAISPDMFATDIAIELTAAGTPFRDAYRTAATDLAAREGRTALGSLRARTSPGGAANPQLDELSRRLSSLR